MTDPVPVPPEVVRANAEPTIPLVVVIDKADWGFLIENVTVAVAVPEVEPVAVIVTVLVEVVVGVPEITPVLVFKVNPLGNVPLENVTVPVSPVVLNVEEDVIAEFGIPEIVCVEGVIEEATLGAEASLGATGVAVTPFFVQVPNPLSTNKIGVRVVSLMLYTANPSL